MISLQRNGKGSVVIEVGFAQASISLKKYTDSFDDGKGSLTPVIIDDSIELEFDNEQNLKYLLSRLLDHFELVGMPMETYYDLIKTDFSQNYNIVDGLVEKNA